MSSVAEWLLYGGSFASGLAVSASIRAHRTRRRQARTDEYTRRQQVRQTEVELGWAPERLVTQDGRELFRDGPTGLVYQSYADWELGTRGRVGLD